MPDSCACLPGLADGILVSPEQLPLPSKEEAAQLAADYLAQ